MIKCPLYGDIRLLNCWLQRFEYLSPLPMSNLECTISSPAGQRVPGKQAPWPLQSRTQLATLVLQNRAQLATLALQNRAQLATLALRAEDSLSHWSSRTEHSLSQWSSRAEHSTAGHTGPPLSRAYHTAPPEQSTVDHTGPPEQNTVLGIVINLGMQPCRLQVLYACLQRAPLEALWHL